MSSSTIKRHRSIEINKHFSFLFIHNQSNKKGDLDPDRNQVPLGQAADSNAICLGTRHDILITSLPIEKSYLDYWTHTLNLSAPQVFSPKKFNKDLVQSVIDSKEELVQFIKQKQEEKLIRKQLVLSVFEADENDIQLLEILQKAGLDTLISECNYDLLSLGLKDGFRDFCRDNEITQLAGGSFKTVEDLEKFVSDQHQQGHTIVIKSPHGIGGGDQIRLKPHNESGKEKWQDTVQQWLQSEKAVEAEQFANSPESEQVVDVYIDPLDQHHTAVMFDQLVTNKDENAGMAYFGAKYPSCNQKAAQVIMDQIEKKLVPAFQKKGYRGPAGIDVLWNPLHFMELNMRTDAITYVKHLTDRIGQRLYESEPGTTAFMSLVNLPLKMSISELMDKHADVFAKKEDGIFALSNPNRQRWGFFDVVAVSPHDLKTAESVMKRGLIAVWGEEQANAFIKSIYHPSATHS